MPLSFFEMKTFVPLKIQVLWTRLTQSRAGWFFTWLARYQHRCWDLLVLALYIGICFVTSLKHEPWRDEAMPWLMARDSSFFELMFENLRYELHPMAWYVVLFFVAHCGFPYFALLVTHLVIASLAVGLFVWKAPLPRILKYGLAFSYYMMSEYVLIARHYSLSILALFLVASFYRTRFEKPLWYGAAILLLFNTEYLCATTGIGLTFLYGLEIFFKKPIEKKQIRGLSLMVMGLLMMAWQVLRVAKDQDYIVDEKGINPMGLIMALSKIFSPVFWHIPRQPALILGLTVLTLGFVYLLRRPMMAFLMALCYAGPFYIFLFKHHHAELSITRHYGFIIMILLFLLWIDQDTRAEEGGIWREVKKRKRIFAGIYAALILMMTAGLWFSIRYTYFTHRMDRMLPYSGGKMMAEAIEIASSKTSGIKETIVGYPQGYMASVIPYLPGRKFWDPQRRAYETFVISKLLPAEDRELTPQQVIVRAGVQFGDISRLFFVFTNPLPFSELFGYTFVPVFSASRGVWGIGLEQYFLYKAFRKEPALDAVTAPSVLP